MAIKKSSVPASHAATTDNNEEEIKDIRLKIARLELELEQIKRERKLKELNGEKLDRKQEKQKEEKKREDAEMKELDMERKNTSIAIKGLPPIWLRCQKSSGYDRTIQHPPALGFESNFNHCEFIGPMVVRPWSLYMYAPQQRIVGNEVTLDRLIESALIEIVQVRTPALAERFRLDFDGNKWDEVKPNLCVFRDDWDVKVGQLRTFLGCKLVEGDDDENTAHFTPTSADSPSKARSTSTVNNILLNFHRNNKGALENDWVFGEMFDYLQTLRTVHGVKNPFGILSTWSQWRVCWLPCADNVAAEVGPALDTDPDKLFEHYISMDQDTGDKFDEASRKAMEMMSSLQSHITDEALKQPQDVQQELQNILKSSSSSKGLPRVLALGKIMQYDQGEELINCLASAIVKMMSNHPPCFDLEVVFNDPQQYSGCQGEMLQSGSANPIPGSFTPPREPYKWGMLPHHNASKYFLLRSVGGGRDSKNVWVVAAGSTVAILKFRKCINDSSAKQLAKREAENWNRIYGDGTAEAVQFGLEWAVLMPYFKPVTKDELKGKADECLKRWSEQGYFHQDIELRHFGKDMNDNIVLFDLSDVVECREGYSEMMRVFQKKTCC